ncbi:MAG: hydrogenase formation protein HypD [Deltaproteobacteria bacterium]|nr:hydrogenase formation protein HypD [Deltaproteobacteria bacterium]
MAELGARFGREARRLLDELRAWEGRPLTFMEVCGTHTMSAARAGLHQLLPPTIRLVSGPGCPVCVTPVGYVDHALALAARPEVTLCSFGDMMRVPGSPPRTPRAAPPTLGLARAGGADVRVVFSPLGALELARDLPGRQVVFLGVGFETTAPALGAAILRAAEERLDNFSMLVAAKTIPGALAALVGSPDLRLDGLLLPGHVSVVLGRAAYLFLADRHRVPSAIAGFEPVEMLRGLAALVGQVRRGEARIDNCYPGAVTEHGNERARAVIERVFEPVDSEWRGLGSIPQSGLGVRAAYAAHDAARRFAVSLPPPVEPAGCRCGDVLRGLIDPGECGLFATECTPDQPRGACMVSSEGSCAARYHYRAEAR